MNIWSVFRHQEILTNGTRRKRWPYLSATCGTCCGGPEGGDILATFHVKLAGVQYKESSAKFKVLGC